MDIVDSKTRSKMMSAVRAKNTKLETQIRRRLFAQGFRYRLHTRDLPGTPDMVFPKYSTILFVHGCFWHLHGCARSSIPENRREWWHEKLMGNKARDAKAQEELSQRGWRVLIVWECSLRRPGVNREDALYRICKLVINFLQSTSNHLEISGPPPEAIQKELLDS